MTKAHDTVLRREAVDALLGDPAGFYVDGTFGRGGHSREILRRMAPGGRLLGVDKDHEAETAAAALAGEDRRFLFRRGSFAALPALLASCGASDIDGLLLDLGVSSPQLDRPERGFSFRRDGPLDMRMDRQRGESAAEWLRSAPEREIAQVLRQYGEERYARRIAAAIVRERARQALTGTAQLAAIVSAAHPRWEPHRHPATRVFQAIRIRVNRELEDLRDLLGVVLDLLRIGGRLVVISFHSLEDRMVKRYLRDRVRGPRLPREVPLTAQRGGGQMRLLGAAVRAGVDERAANPRARSAIMRCAQRVA